jgi:hypothetical protein
MTPEQEAHLERIQQQSVKALDSKYRRGQAEHGGNLFDKTAFELLEEALAENTDQRVYILTAMEKLEAGDK